jgi:hypothetical protein
VTAAGELKRPDLNESYYINVKEKTLSQRQTGRAQLSKTAEKAAIVLYR